MKTSIHRGLHRACRRRDERGAVAVVAAATSLLLVAVAALTVDIGMQRVARTDMQSLADVVALDLALELGSRTVDEFENQAPTIETLAMESRDRNKGTVGSVPSLSTTLGRIDANGDFQELFDDAVPTAVQVAARTSVDFAFGIATSGSAERSAVSQQTEDTACFELGSFAAALDLGDSVLGPFADFLGLGTELELVNYEALASADVSLLGIAAAPAIGSPTALLDPSGVSVGTLIEASIYALQHNEDAGSAENNAAIAVLNGLLETDSGLDLDGTVAIADVVSVDAGDSAALSAGLNVLELIGPSLALANDDSFLDVAVPIDLSSLGLGAGSLTVSAIQGPRFACGHPWPTPDDSCTVVKTGGGACARQSQVSIALVLEESTIPLIDLSGFAPVSAGVTATVGPISLAGGVGNGKGVLSSVDSCGPPDQITVSTRSGLLGVELEVPITLGGSVAVDLSVLPTALQNLVGNVLNLPGLLSGLLGGFEYQYRAYRLTATIDEVGATLRASSEGTTSAEAAQLESPTNDRPGAPVRVPESPQPLSLGDLAVPSSLLSGGVTVALTYEWRRRSTTIAGIPTGSWSDWKKSTDGAPPGSSSGPLFSGDLSGLATLSAPLLGTVDVAISSSLNQVIAGLNNQVIDTVNDILGDTLLPLLGLSGSGMDLYSVSRPLCGGPPQLVG